MARLITISLQCDWRNCTTVGEEGDGTVVEKTAAVDGKPARTFLLCKGHLEEFDEIVLPLLQAGLAEPSKDGKAKPETRRKGTKRSTAGKQDFDCQAPSTIRPGRCGREVRSRVGMAQHVIRAHGFDSLAEYEARYPQPIDEENT